MTKGKVKISKYHSITLNCTHDLNKTEKMTLIIKYALTEQEDINICGHFWGLRPNEKSTSQLFNVLHRKLEN